MIVTYLFNSGFVIELEEHILLFDYYKGKLPSFNPNKKLYVFASHVHHDHYNPDIYKINHPNITYILDQDIDNNGIKVQPNTTINVDDLVISTLLSTDLGVAFIVNVENKYFYHAGDLNWWHWTGEDEADNNYQEKTFKQEIDKIKHISFDLMMIPLDPRLKSSAHLGMNYILNNITTKYVLPMHFFTLSKKMQEFIQLPPLNKYSNIISINHKNEIFNLD